MCLAIYKPAGRWASKEKMENGFRSNPDGAGYAFHDGKKVVIKKGFMTFTEFWTSFKDDVNTATPALIHFRIGTKGKKNAENTHPFKIGHGALIHNGPCLNYTHCKGDEHRSDTAQFAEDFIGDLTSYQVERLIPMIESFIGSEKICFMFDDGAVFIANFKNGNVKDGCWWSNHSYESYTNRYTGAKQTTTTTTTTNYRHRVWNAKTQQYEEDTTYNSELWSESRWEPGKPYNSVPFGLPDALKGAVCPCVWSKKFRQVVPYWIKAAEEEDVCYWDDTLSAYIPEGVSKNVMSDGTMIYDLVEDTVTNGGVAKAVDYIDIAEVVQTVDDLKFAIHTSIICADAKGTPVRAPGKALTPAPAETKSPNVVH
jgi:predicted glutamine amidotransferase